MRHGQIRDHRSGAAGFGRTVRAAMADGDVTGMARLTREQIADVLHEQREGEMGCERKDPRNCLYWHEEAERADAVLPLVNESLAAREDQLRQLLSYCQEQSARERWPMHMRIGDAYTDVVLKLAAILDGES